MRRVAILGLWIGLGCSASLDLASLDEGCPAGFKACGESCVLVSDPMHGCGTSSCAPCDIPQGTARCDPVQGCVIDTCLNGFKECDGRCVSRSDPNYGCGWDGCNACYVHNGEASCNSHAECSVAQCDFRWDDCNDDYLDGCETNLNSDLNNCGSCGNVCTDLAHAAATCGGAACVIRLCDVGFADCNGVAYDGCERPVSADPRNCGGCGVLCEAGTACVDGVCQ